MATINHLGFAVLAVVGALLGGCVSNAPSQPYVPAADNAASLAAGDVEVVTAAAREMIAIPTADVHGLRSRPSTDGTGKDICGYVQTTAGHSTALYVELREKDGAMLAARGQVARTPANAAKVKFQCRHHGDW